MAMPHISQGMKTMMTMMMKSGVAMPAAVSRISPTNVPATPRINSERQYLALLMRPLAPNKNSSRSSMASLHANAPANPRGNSVSFGGGAGFNQPGQSPVAVVAAVGRAREIA